MVEDEVFVFCDRQKKIVLWFYNMKLIEPIEVKAIKHPITNRLECLIQVYKANKIISEILQFLVFYLVSKEGKEAMKRLEKYGLKRI